MLKVINFLVPFLVLTTLCNAQEEEDKYIEATFNNYKSAILNDKGEEAVKYVDSRTIKYYEDILELTKNADSTKINSLSILNKLTVFSIRHRVSKEDILSFDGEGLLVYAIENGMIGKNSVANISIGKITIDNYFAKGQAVINEQEVPLYFHFYKEKDNWKIDLTSIFPSSNIALEEVIRDSEGDENEYLFLILEMLTGKKPGIEIWNSLE